MFHFLMAIVALFSPVSPAVKSHPTLVSSHFLIAEHKSDDISGDQLQLFLSQKVLPSDSHLNGIRLVRCQDKDEFWSGTMVHYNNRNQYLTAAHVADATQCYDAATKVPLRVNYIDRHTDFAVFESPVVLDNMIYKLSCNHYTTGHKYHAIGWAGGNDLTAMDITAKRTYTDPFFIIAGTTMAHLREFDGTIIAGQSGGAVVDDQWTIFGINNASDDTGGNSWSRELADTPLCKH